MPEGLPIAIIGIMLCFLSVLIYFDTQPIRGRFWVIILGIVGLILAITGLVQTM